MKFEVDQKTLDKLRKKAEEQNVEVQELLERFANS